MKKVFLAQIETRPFPPLDFVLSDLGIFEDKKLAIDAGQESGYDYFYVTEFELNARGWLKTSEFIKNDDGLWEELI